MLVVNSIEQCNTIHQGVKCGVILIKIVNPKFMNYQLNKYNVSKVQIS